MPVVSEMVHPRGLDFRNQRKVVLLRDVHKRKWNDVQGGVRNVAGEVPSLTMVRNVYRGFKASQGRRPTQYHRCGRKPWTVTGDVERFLLPRLLALRKVCICTSATLQAELMAQRGIHLEGSTIRRILQKHGYRWLPRRQKPAVSPELAQERVDFAKRVLRLSRAALRAKLSLSLDGVVLSMPPDDETDRRNYCFNGVTHMYRRRDEAAQPELAGEDPYAQQIPMARCLPLWGGISKGGFASVLWHDTRKLTTVIWAQAVREGKLRAAIRALSPVSRIGPWTVLADGETFLWAPESQRAYTRTRVSLWRVPPKSPDLNPVEKMWGWVRKELRMKDLADLKARRRVPSKPAYKARIVSLLQSRRAQEVASKYACGYRKVCKDVVKARGARTRH